MNPNRVFAIACCALVLMVFSQLLVAGLALAARFEQAQKIQIVEREVEKLVPYPVVSNLIQPKSQPYTPPALPPIPTPKEIELPTIADPRAERLFTEARTARIASDMGLAIIKLEEALQQSPNEPNILFELGVVHELMGIYDQAARYYEQVFQMGITGAGELYAEAATKLRDGFEQPEKMRGKIALGRVRIFNNPKASGGQRVVLSVPVLKAPAQEIETSDIEVAVTFFNKTTNDKIVQLADESWAKTSWTTLPFDWAGGEETLGVTYQIPERDNQTEHLFGELSYYGQVATLTYKGEILDVQAWPRDLAARMGQSSPTGNSGGVFPEFLNQDTLPPNFDPDIPLLNPLPPE